MIFENDWDMLIKSHKYSRKEFRNGTWYYYYDKHNNFARMTRCKSKMLTFKINRWLTEEEKCKQVERQAVDYIKNVWLADWQKKTPNDKSICMELRNKKVVFKNISYKHIGKQGKNSRDGIKNRNLQNLLRHVRYLPLAKELLENNGVWTHARYETLKKPRKDKTTGKNIVAHMYQSVTGKTPEGDSNNYVQATVSKVKYSDSTYGDTVYISVVGVKDIKKSTDFVPCLHMGKSGVKDIHFFTQAGTMQSCALHTRKNWQSHSSNIPRNNRPVNKSIEINITDITEGNRYAKFEQLEKCLSGIQPIFIPADNTRRLPDVKILLKDGSEDRIEKALRTMSMSFRIPTKSAKGEVFQYKAQEDLTDKWCVLFSEFVSDVYDFVIEYFGLPKKTVMSKSENLTYKGKVLYYPETGEPIKKKDWDRFVSNLEKFLNRNKLPSERITLQAKSLAHILNRMLKYNTLSAVKNARLKDVKYNGKTFDWISDSVKNMKNALGTEMLSRNEQARIEMIQQSSAIKVQNITEKMRGDIKQILVDGVRAKKSKSQVSQDLFDRMVGDNRDFQKLADTEIQNVFNTSFVREEVHNTPEGEKIYFKRVEVIDDNTCEFCKKNNGKIAVWSDKPLKSEISTDTNADYVIWEGKEWNGKESSISIGAWHPYCYSDDTEVMTNNGWKLFKDVEKNETIMSINPETREIGFVPFVQKVEYEYNGKMIHFIGYYFDLLVTPDHNMLYVDENENIKEIRARELYKQNNFSIPVFVGEWGKADSRALLFDDIQKSQEIEYSGKVYDVELEKWHFLLVRRNGKCAWSGNCRGTWVRHYIGNEAIDALVAENSKKAEKWNKAVYKAREEFRKKGIQNPDDSTRGYTERIQEIFQGDDVEKSLTWSGYKLQGRRKFAGLDISIENRKGSVRRGTDEDGHEWETKMKNPYGYIRGTIGVDGDHLDCFLGDNEDAKYVYVIHQKDPVTNKYDEDKCMLGFNTLEDAKKAYLAHYDRPGFIQSISTIPIDTFKEKVLAKKNHGKKVSKTL